MITFIFLQLVTIIICIINSYNCVNNLLLKIAKKGYKFQTKNLNYFLSKNKFQNKLPMLLSYILMLIPGVNIIYINIKNNILINDLISDLYEQKILVGMTPTEKEQFRKLISKKDKINFIIDMVLKESIQPINLNENNIDPDNVILCLKNEHLTPLAYTLDEVKKLSTAANHSYIIGKIDNINTAIIGIPANLDRVKEVRFLSENFNTNHQFEKIPETETKGKTFLVYPFKIENEKSIKKAIDEIIEARSNTNRNPSIKYIQRENFQNNNITNDRKALIKNELVLKRVLTKTIK